MGKDVIGQAPNSAVKSRYKENRPTEQFRLLILQWRSSLKHSSRSNSAFGWRWRHKSVASEHRRNLGRVSQRKVEGLCAGCQCPAPTLQAGYKEGEDAGRTRRTNSEVWVFVQSSGCVTGRSLKWQRSDVLSGELRHELIVRVDLVQVLTRVASANGREAAATTLAFCRTHAQILRFEPNAWYNSPLFYAF